ncbi:potassium/sodium hyperpolarization-activated cyclic nucleotide-gated channel 2-like [Tribolium castaneum]|uniref:potassium/sodium hyperpolarization-activated cyclic nucleotide-gated channel 2-like n=1 Tax=Tribolium castaneum TaxID=7070 RepID=UPI00077DD1C3|nr:PREDICTED: potassium/sodium hyperpolarization-activated cyclic nucleotide-gated channel 2-like [Tribolium castaneum]|eukprot:XP_015836691.1 PREDICTED: potassium/sodium hyperpolarization-activated cyclic nucleotide-gated channel 2-like [Tribolium castaneum]
MPQRPHRHTAGGKISFVTRHVCKLDRLELQRELPRVAPFAPAYKKCLYSFRKWTVVSRYNPESKLYFRSNLSLFKEQQRQLRNKKLRMVIHPLSKFAMYRKMFIGFLWMIAFVIDPLFNAFISPFYTVAKDVKYKEVTPQELILMIMNCVFLVDTIVQFFMGFLVPRTKEIVLDPQRVAREYLNAYFLYDFIPAVYGIIYYVCNIEYLKDLFKISIRVRLWLKIPPVYAVRFVRINSMLEYIVHTLQFFRVRESFIKCITIALMMMLIIHWWTCVLYILPVITYYERFPLSNSYILKTTLGTNRPLDNVYVDCLLCTVCHFFGAGTGNIETENPFEQLVLALILICGIACHIYVIAEVLHLFGTINVSEAKYEELIYQLNEYMVTKKLPFMLRKRLLMYYEYRYQKHFFMEHLILNSLSEHLRYEILLYGCRNLINKVKLFQGAPKQVIGALVALLKQEIFLPDDKVVKLETVNNNVYFISYGTVAVCLPDGREAFHMEDGQHFGEMYLVTQEHYMAEIVAVEITEVYYLDSRDFWYVVSTHPELADNLEKTALVKAVALKEIAAALDTAIDTSDILMELRKGHIIKSGRKR